MIRSDIRTPDFIFWAVKGHMQGRAEVKSKPLRPIPEVSLEGALGLYEFSSLQ